MNCYLVILVLGHYEHLKSILSYKCNYLPSFTNSAGISQLGQIIDYGLIDYQVLIFYFPSMHSLQNFILFLHWMQSHIYGFCGNLKQ